MFRPSKFCLISKSAICACFRARLYFAEASQGSATACSEPEASQGSSSKRPFFGRLRNKWGGVSSSENIFTPISKQYQQSCPIWHFHEACDAPPQPAPSPSMFPPRHHRLHMPPHRELLMFSERQLEASQGSVPTRGFGYFKAARQHL